MPDDVEEPLEGGWQTDVRKAGDVVLRSAKPQSETVIALLVHLRRAGFDAAPCPIGSGFAADGREQLTFIDGESPQPKAWSDEAAWQVGHLLRRLHHATASFVPPTEAVWRPWFARTLPDHAPVIGHGDLGPWNILARDGLPVAFIDWDNAGPVDAHWELAQVGWLNAQLHDDDVSDLNDLPTAADRARQLGLILDGYQLGRSDRAGFVDKLIEFAIRSAREEARGYGVGPDSVSPQPMGSQSCGVSPGAPEPLRGCSTTAASSTAPSAVDERRDGHHMSPRNVKSRLATGAAGTEPVD